MKSIIPMSDMAEGYLLGVISLASLTASLFFFKFWRRTRDNLFLAFAVAFLVESANRVSVLFTARPSESGPWYYIVRMAAFLLIIAAIIRNNTRRT